MKKLRITQLALLCGVISLQSCGALGNEQSTTSAVGNVLGSIFSQSTGNELLNLVIGSQKVDQNFVVGSWQYAEPAVAFTSKELLAKAGGAIAAGQVKQKLVTAYQKVGITSSNTQLTLTTDKRFNATINGMNFSGTYTFDPATQSIKLKATLMSLTGYVTRTTNGMAVTLESDKMLTLIQGMALFTGDSSLKELGELSKKFDGMRIGLGMVKTN